ncbi:Two component regulator propeller [Salinivirga cyanobacteriivorans]|uniref:Two component regulator propeller n=1 Tax=Salinivirga cyanobacteriivorans TaxID=1307839 RepID=A0A0S2I044_9BACT|nr:T9SS type A sorting domain-containing protein [Salinivirga cyanobacteriivorans]ALO15639.1 Two component regulator propeller [Salinivirga cyanobacteriivorans]
MGRVFLYYCIATLVILSGQISFVFGQGYNIGDWESHFSYRQVELIDGNDSEIFASTSNAIFKYDIESGEFQTFSTVEGLSGVNISAIKYHSRLDFLMVGYSSGLVDFIYHDEIFTLPDIQQNTSLNAKSVNNIHFAGDTAFLACDFGLVLVDISEREVQSTFFLGSSGDAIMTYDVSTGNDTIWVGTDKGVYYAARTGINLHNYQNWSVLESLSDYDQHVPFIEKNASTIFIGQSRPEDTTDIIYEYENGVFTQYLPDKKYRVRGIEKRNDILTIIASYGVRFYGQNGNLLMSQYFNGYNDHWGHSQAAVLAGEKVFFADPEYGLVLRESGEESFMFPNSPFTNAINDIEVARGKLFLTGGISGAKYKDYGMYIYDDQWINLNRRNTEELFTVRNLNFVLPDPGNNSHFFATSNGYGLLEFMDTAVINHFDQDNSPLENFNNLEQAYILASGIAYDNNKDVWITTSQVPNNLYVYKTALQEWDVFSLQGSISNRVISNLTEMPWGDLWFVDQDFGLVAIDPEKLKNGAVANGYKRFRVIGSDNSILTNFVTTMAVDQDNYVWIGLDEGGIAVYYNAQSVMNYNVSASRIIVENDGIAQYLLENERVSCIAVDPGNRKWVGTQTGGVFLISEDGTEQILNLNKENSPLPSDFVRDIGIDTKNGWVYIATEEGLVAYYTGIKESNAEPDKLRVYPNPVHEDYNDLVHIDGLGNKMKVKITDVAGNIVFETTSNGGTALWNMRDFNNQRVTTGVYMIYASSFDGTTTAAAKIFVVSR